MRAPTSLDRWLLENERRAVAPFKGILWAATVLLWMWQTRWMLPDLQIFAAFSVYFFFLVAGAYLLFMNRIHPAEARVYCVASYFLDISYISVLIYFDQQRLQLAGAYAVSDYFYFYFLLVLRGYSLSMGKLFNLLINLLMAGLFVASYGLAQKSLIFLLSGLFQIKLGLLWMLILMSWFIVGLIDQYKSEIMAARERFLKTRHLVELGEMAGVMAHEINNPVGVISANAEFLLRKGPDDDVARNSLQVIMDQSQRCKAIISEVLDFTRPLPLPRPMRVDVVALCEEAVRLAFPNFPEGDNPVSMQKEEEAAWAMADPPSLRKAVINVLTNARQVIGSGGKIEVVICKSDQAPRPVEIAIRDCGPTPSSEDMKRAFEPFFTRQRGGSGLGLAVARRLMENQGGRMDVTLPADGAQGMVTRLFLPSAPPPDTKAPGAGTRRLPPLLDPK